MRKIVFILLTILSICGTCFAEPKEIIAEGTYIMGDNDTPIVAEARALINAKRTAIEQAGTYLESYSKTKNLELTKDEITTIAAGVIQTTVLDKKRTPNENGTITFWVKIKGIVNNDELYAKIKDKRNWKLIDTYNVKIDQQPVLTYVDTNSINLNKNEGYIECWIKTKFIAHTTYYKRVRFLINDFSYQTLEEISDFGPGIYTTQQKFKILMDWKQLPSHAPLYKEFSLIQDMVFNETN